jgi:uncharacterized Zn finger protein (UPF0148 family)
MPNCPHCGAVVPEGTVYCGNCGAAKDSTSSASISQFRVTGQESTLPSSSSSGDLQLQLEKVMRRAELLTYAAVGLGVALLAVIIGISLL